ncbi:MAG: hypothetical protein B7Y75_05125 [Azorhizobium sp. 35-67-5]|nr:MAG: hypothetical protein B7Y75_05125 [Azorhizobium sp. 35-67-5]
MPPRPWPTGAPPPVRKRPGSWISSSKRPADASNQREGLPSRCATRSSHRAKPRLRQIDLAYQLAAHLVGNPAQPGEAIDLLPFRPQSRQPQLALDLVKDASRLSQLRYERGEALAAIAGAPPSDLVIASYVINELDDGPRARLVASMWDKTEDVLLIVEPGTPAGFARIVATRAQLIAKGAHVIAPCPHDGACPMMPPDWCHFSQRLRRSRAHKHLKGAELPFEDERFSYVALSRTPAAEHPSRVLSQPAITKIAVTAKLCTTNGIKTAVAPHRHKISYARSRKWNWGDAVADLPAE